MKYLLIASLFVLTLMFGCSKNNIATGIKGKVEYGQGDCMPIIDYESRVYDKFNGDVLFILKDNLGNGDFDQLKNNSIRVTLKNGELSAQLPIGTYLIMPEDVYLYSEDNTITIKPNEVLNNDFKFWKCTSY